MSEKGNVPVILEVRANSPTPFAEVIHGSRPVGARRRAMETEQLVQIPVRQDLRPKHRVAVESQGLEVIRRPLQIARHERPPEDRPAAQVDGVLATADMLAGLGAGSISHRVDDRRRGQADRDILVLERAGLEPVPGNPHSACTDRSVEALEVISIHLAKNLRLQPHQTLIAGHRGQHLAV